jgi:DNA-binding MarR family transcriptional regulator
MTEQTTTFSPNDHCAHEVLDVVPQIMQHIRGEMRKQRGPDLSVLQFRALAFLRRRPGAPLSALAEHVGLTLPSMSSQVSGLVARKLIDRSTSTTDRRYVTLTLTEEGRALLDAARMNTQSNLAESLAQLSAAECATVMEAMRLLAGVFAPDGAGHLPDSLAPHASVVEYFTSDSP